MAEECDVPGVEINTREGDLTPGPNGHRYVHIDTFESAESSGRSSTADKQSELESHDEPGVELHLYAFQSDDKREELLDVMQDLRQDYILATGIIWPDEIREGVEEADTFRMRALEWAYAVSGHMAIEPEELPRIADQAEEYIEPTHE